MADADADLALLAETARAAGRAAMDFYGSGALKVWDKDANAPGRSNPVCEADLAAESLLKDRLRAARPHYGWLSEETADDRSRLRAARSFVVDPIDGTRAFIKGREEFTIVAAVIEDGRPEAGVIYDPAKDRMYSAVRGGGAHADGVRLAVSEHSAIQGARILGDAGRLRDLRDLGAQAFNVNSAALRLALVAEGVYDAVVAVRPKWDWDLAAGHLIVEEAGGIVTGADGQPLAYDRDTAKQPPPLAAGPVLHALLLERLNQER